jgi:hypothetical protein
MSERADTLMANVDKLIEDNRTVEAYRDHLENKLSSLFNEIASKTRKERLG